MTTSSDAPKSVAAPAKVEAPASTNKHKVGDRVLASGVLADQVNPLTNQRLPHGQAVIALFDRWIEIQVEAGVVSLTSI